VDDEFNNFDDGDSVLLQCVLPHLSAGDRSKRLNSLL